MKMEDEATRSDHCYIKDQRGGLEEGESRRRQHTACLRINPDQSESNGVSVGYIGKIGTHTAILEDAQHCDVKCDDYQVILEGTTRS
jgi:hypothetical protein